MDKAEEISNLIIDAFKEGNKVLTFGVGGNAANAIHFAAELAGKYEKYETPLPCIDLCSNPSILTAITNDFGWEHVFERQIKALAKPGDVVVAFSISTKGQYLINALLASVERGCSVSLICGKYTPIDYYRDDGYRLGQLQDLDRFLVWELDSSNTPQVQEEQLRIVHQVCKMVKSKVEVD